MAQVVVDAKGVRMDVWEWVERELDGWKRIAGDGYSLHGQMASNFQETPRPRL